MQQIINITLGGRNIAIENEAYQKVKAYTDSLHEYFKNEEGRDEIVSDIEARFAELMSEKIRKGASHITDADVEEMIATLGRPEDFAAQENGGAEDQNPNFTFSQKRRLYRDESNKILGGVCSGIANWLNIDPTVVRVLFAIVSFGGFGTGVIIYIALWIFLPARNMDIYKGKRMFRDSDNKWFGGVAGGMGAYFNINPNTIRCILSIPLLLSLFRGVNLFGWHDDFDIFPNLIFSGLTGTFIFIYIVLWMVLPEALTPYQKMEMRGKNIDVNSIKENIHQRMQSWGKEVKESAERLSSKAGDFAGRKGYGQNPDRPFAYYPSQRGRGVGYVFAMIFKAFFVIIGGIIAVSLLAVFITFLFSGFAWTPVNNFLWTNETQQILGWGTLLLFLGTPIVGMVIWLVRKILNVRTPGNYLSWTFGGLWAIGWVCLMFFLASISNDFKRYESIEEQLHTQQPINGRMIFKVSQPELTYQGNFGWANSVNSELKGFSLTADTLKISTISIDFQKSDDSLYHLTLVKQSMGKTDADAMDRAKKIIYNVSSLDSVIDLQSGFSIDKNNKYRGQNVLLLVQVPVGKKIYLDETIFDKLCDVNIDFNDGSKRIGNSRYRTHNINRYRSNTDYTMQTDGSLKSDDATTDSIEDAGNNKDDNYRWKGTSSATENDTLVNVAPPASIAKDTAKLYRYNESSTDDKSKEQLNRELEQKQKEIEAIKKKLAQ